MEILATVVNEEKIRPQKRESQILGRDPSREDWIRDVHLRLSAIFTNPSDKDLDEIYTDRFKYRAAYARPAMETICKVVDNRPEGYLNEIRKVREIVAKSCGGDLNDCSPASEAIVSHIAKEVADVRLQRTGIYEEWNEVRDRFGEGPESVTNILRALKSIGSHTGSDRTMQIKELRKQLLYFLTVSAEIPPVLHLCLGWLTLQLHDGLEEAMGYFRLGSQSVLPLTSSYFCCRMLSDAYERESQIQRAMEWSKKALEHSRTSEACIDLTLLIAQSHEIGSLKGLLEEALLSRPLCLIGLLADERSLDLGTDILDVVVKVQARLRRNGRQSIATWQDAVKDANEAERIASSDLQLGHELLESHAIITERLAEADLITAGYLSDYALEAATDLINQVKESLQREFDKKREALSDARVLIDSVGMARDQRVIAARKEHDHRIAAARGLLSDAATRTQGMEKQSIYWFGSGCGLFGLYVATKFVLSSGSNQGQVSSPLGMLMLLISGVPIALAIVLQVVFGVRRATLEIQVREKIADANKKFSQAEREADDFHREQLANSRKALTEAENKLKRIESAAKYLKVEPEEESVPSLRLRAA